MPFYIGQVSEYALIVNGEGRILLLRHAGRDWPDFKGRNHLPGGRLEMDDQPGEGLLREIAEETGLEGVELILPCATSRWGAMTPVKYSVCYLARVSGVPDVTLPPHEDHDGYEWVTPEEAPTRQYLFPAVNSMVAEAIGWARRLGVLPSA